MASSSKSASASTSTSTADDNPYYTFNVFLNHRGPDGKPFAISLYNRFKSHAHLRVFLDRDELERGEELTPQINGAIRASSVNIAIFTPRYCESEWCLKELVLMLECKRTKGSTILPIFFHVKPSVVKWTQDEYGKALSSRQKKRNADGQLRYKPEIIGKWKEALHDVAEIIGYELDEEPYIGDESKLLDDVVEKVLKLVPKPPLHVSIYPTGLEEKVKYVKERLQKHESGKVKVVGIVGLGGVGKTTLAKEFYNRQNKVYSRSIFLFHVREDSRGNLEKLQRQLIKELSGKDTEINDTAQGIHLLEKHLPHWHALISLDDVDDIEQLRALLPVLPAKDSLILVTSRDRSVLQNWELIEDPFIYTLEGLSPPHSVELFCQHAFHRPDPPDAAFAKLVTKFVDACGQLPLSLCVIGALLHGEKNPENWEAQLRKIRRILPMDIQKVLKISYDSLDDEEKKIFLDVACFFVGKEKDTAMMIWEASGWAASLGLETLRNKHLVELEEDEVQKDEVEYSEGQPEPWYRECRVECIRMHDHLRDMGRHLADNEPLLRRIWRVTENLSDLSPVEGTRNSAERGRRVSELRWRKPDSAERDRRVRNLGWSAGLAAAVSMPGSCVEGVFNVEQPPQLILLRCYNCPDPFLPRNISTKNLGVLHIEGSNLETLWDLESESEAPRELRELYIVGSRVTKIPQYIGQLRRLEKVVLRSEKDIVSFETLPDEFCQLQSLKHLELHEKGLKSLPESFGDLSSLEYLNLAGCTCLKKLPDSCRNLTKLQHLDLSSCMKLRRFPDFFGNLANLQHINLSDCKVLKTLPNTFGNLSCIKFLSLKNCLGSTIASETLGNITTLEHLHLPECLAELPRQLTSQRFLQVLHLYLSSPELPEAIGNLSNLKILSINSSELERPQPSFELPPSFGDLRSLEELRLNKCGFEYFPDCIRMLTQLKMLGLSNMDLKRLKITEWFSGLPTTLETLEISGCKGMEELSGLERLESLEDLQIKQCEGLKRIHGLAQLTKLLTLDVQHNEDLEELPGIEGSQSLDSVNASMCPKLKREYESSHGTCEFFFE